MRRVASATFLLLLCVAFAGHARLHAGEEDVALRLLAETLAKVDDPQTQASLLQGMLSGLEGRRNIPPPEAWERAAASLGKSDDARVRELAGRLSQIFGDETAIQVALETAADSQVPTDQRRRALHSVLRQKDARVIPVLRQLLAEDALRLDAIRGFAAVADAEAPALLLGRFDQWPATAQRAVIETLATRDIYAKALWRALRDKRIAREQIPAHVARSLGFLLGEEFIEEFGSVPQLAKDRVAAIAAYKQKLTSDALADADARRGRVVFNKTCAACHKLYDAGGDIGPNLTGSNRANLDYLLLNSVDPSYDVPDSYKMVTIRTDDGRVINGVIAEEDARRVVLKTVEQPRLVVLKADIERRQVSPKSMMPEGQLDKLQPQELFDLVKYLQTIEQVEAPQ